MTIRSIALSAMAVTFSLCAADLSVAPLAIYYSFDTPPSAALVTEMESEIGRILAAGQTSQPLKSPPVKPKQFLMIFFID